MKEVWTGSLAWTGHLPSNCPFLSFRKRKTQIEQCSIAPIFAKAKIGKWQVAEKKENSRHESKQVIEGSNPSRSVQCRDLGVFPRLFAQQKRLQSCRRHDIFPKAFFPKEKKAFSDFSRSVPAISEAPDQLQGLPMSFFWGLVLARHKARRLVLSSFNFRFNSEYLCL